MKVVFIYRPNGPEYTELPLSNKDLLYHYEHYGVQFYASMLPSSVTGAVIRSEIMHLYEQEINAADILMVDDYYYKENSEGERIIRSAPGQKIFLFHKYRRVDIELLAPQIPDYFDKAIMPMHKNLPIEHDASVPLAFIPHVITPKHLEFERLIIEEDIGDHIQEYADAVQDHWIIGDRAQVVGNEERDTTYLTPVLRELGLKSAAFCQLEVDVPVNFKGLDIAMPFLSRYEWAYIIRASLGCVNLRSLVSQGKTSLILAGEGINIGTPTAYQNMLFPEFIVNQDILTIEYWADVFTRADLKKKEAPDQALIRLDHHSEILTQEFRDFIGISK